MACRSVSWRAIPMMMHDIHLLTLLSAFFEGICVLPSMERSWYRKQVI